MPNLLRRLSRSLSTERKRKPQTATNGAATGKSLIQGSPNAENGGCGKTRKSKSRDSSLRRNLFNKKSKDTTAIVAATAAAEERKGQPTLTPLRDAGGRLLNREDVGSSTCHKHRSARQPPGNKKRVVEEETASNEQSRPHPQRPSKLPPPPPSVPEPDPGNMEVKTPKDAAGCQRVAPDSPSVVTIPEYMCRVCDTPCAGDTLQVQQSFIHLICFRCQTCGQPLDPNNYYTLNSQLLCARDYAAQVAVCHACDNPIEPGMPALAVLGRTFHSQCFICSSCYRQPEPGQEVLIRDKKVFCCDPGSPVCHACAKVIKPGELSLNAGHKSWHQLCFRCCRCATVITDEFFFKDNNQHCLRCYFL